MRNPLYLLTYTVAYYGTKIVAVMKFILVLFFILMLIFTAMKVFDLSIEIKKSEDLLWIIK